MIDKEYTSNIEDKRLNIEEITTTGTQISPRQIWRDTGFIPDSPKNKFTGSPLYFEGIKYYEYCQYDGIYRIPIIRKYIEVPLYKVEGTTNVFKDKYNLLKDLIDRSFDGNPNPENNEDSYQFILYKTNAINKESNELSYGMGDPIIDVESGLLYIRNIDFIDKYVNTIEANKEVFFITFYKYVGRKGTFASPVGTNAYKEDLTGIDLPFRDDIRHFKNSKNGKTATFKVETDVPDGELAGNTDYILPDNDLAWKSNGVFNSSQPAKYIVTNKSKATIMTAETYQEIDWQIGWHNGGIWLPENGSHGASIKRTTNYKTEK